MKLNFQKGDLVEYVGSYSTAFWNFDGTQLAGIIDKGSIFMLCEVTQRVRNGLLTCQILTPDGTFGKFACEPSELTQAKI